jgi:predicted DNA binding CopG/RHH family protein
MPKNPKPRPVGRPKLEAGKAKGKIVPVRFASEDLKRIHAAATGRKIPLSRWIRETLNAAIQG